jgi:predicted N-acyltransferase
MTSQGCALEVRVLDAVGRVPAEAWDALVGDASPFLEHAFLSTLEETGSVGGDTGWLPVPVTVWRGERLVGAAPAYVKEHSYGEYVYDWQIASWAHRNGVPWYPKLVVGVPFTPVTGRRLLVEDGPEADDVRAALLAGLRRLGAEVCGLHVLFPDGPDAEALIAAGGAERLQHQYHWQNAGYVDFEGFLGALPSKRRTEVRRERRAVSGLRVEALLGDAPGLAGDLADFYARTYQRHTGGEGYLAPSFFEALLPRWAHRVHTVCAYDDVGARIAGTFNVHKGGRLYGRYWGARAEVPYLHFEVAIYAAVDWCIRNGVAVFEPGHGGEHKRSRGFTPTLVRSVHWMTDRRLDAPVRRFFAEEAEAVRRAWAD